MPRFAGLLVVNLFFLFAGAAVASDVADTREGRLAAAHRYLEVARPEAMIDNIVNAIASQGNLSIEQAEFSTEIMAILDIEAMKAVMVEAMVKHFTAAELHALADFFERPEGQAIMRKMGAYSAEVMPFVQQQTIKAITEILSRESQSQ
jgi:hypothetical protein